MSSPAPSAIYRDLLILEETSRLCADQSLSEGPAQYEGAQNLGITPTSDTRLIAQAAINGLHVIYRRGDDDQKAGVLLTELVPAEQGQQGLFDVPEQLRKSGGLMEAMERINRVMGRGTVKLLAEGDDPRWAMRAENRTPRFTTRLEELPVVRTR